MSKPIISEDECIGCGICVDACEHDVLEIEDGVAAVANEDACTGCGDCQDECPVSAIEEIEA